MVGPSTMTQGMWPATAAGSSARSSRARSHSPRQPARHRTHRPLRARPPVEPLSSRSQAERRDGPCSRGEWFNYRRARRDARGPGGGLRPRAGGATCAGQMRRFTRVGAGLSSASSSAVSGPCASATDRGRRTWWQRWDPPSGPAAMPSAKRSATSSNRSLPTLTSSSARSTTRTRCGRSMPLCATLQGHSNIGPQIHLDLWEANRRQLLGRRVEGRPHHGHRRVYRLHPAKGCRLEVLLAPRTRAGLPAGRWAWSELSRHIPRPAPYNPLQMVNWLVIGIGDITRKRVLPAILAEPRSHLHAVSHARSAQGRGVSRCGRPSFASPGPQRPGIDAVYVASPVALHAEQTIAALRAGKQVLCEKPVALDLAQAEQMATVARNYGRLLGIAYYRRLYPKLLRAKHCCRRSHWPARAGRGQLPRLAGEPRARWLKDPALAGGGPLYDVGSHRIDAMQLPLWQAAARHRAALQCAAPPAGRGLRNRCSSSMRAAFTPWSTCAGTRASRATSSAIIGAEGESAWTR